MPFQHCMVCILGTAALFLHSFNNIQASLYATSSMCGRTASLLYNPPPMQFAEPKASWAVPPPNSGSSGTAWQRVPPDKTHVSPTENQNLRMVRQFTTMEKQVVARETEAWRAVVAAKTAERDMLRVRRRQHEGHQE